MWPQVLDRCCAACPATPLPERTDPMRVPKLSVYLPLIDMLFAHPDTSPTAMSKSQQLNRENRIKVSLSSPGDFNFTVEVQWAFFCFSQVIGQIRGYAYADEFCRCSNIDDWLRPCRCSGIYICRCGSPMLTGKKFPMNMRAMRMVAEELLRDIVVQRHSK